MKNAMTISALASTYGAFLRSKGFPVPTAVLTEMLQQERQSPNKQNLDHKIRLVQDSELVWRIVPKSLKELQDVESTEDLLTAMRGLSIQLEDLAPFGTTARHAFSTENSALTAVYLVTPDINKYGVPDIARNGISSWAAENALPQPTKDADYELFDTGEDGGGNAMVELSLDSMTMSIVDAMQQAHFHDLASELLGEMRAKAEKNSFSYNPKAQLHEYADTYPVELAEFRDTVLV